MDMTLIRRSQAGDEAAHAALFQEYKNLVYKTAYLMLGNANEAEDVLQEVFINVFKSISTYHPSKGAFTTWLHRITVNYCLNWRRKRIFSTISVDEVSPSALENQSLSPESLLIEEETIQQALNQLSEKLQAVVILRHYWNLSYAEIAQILDIPIGTVKSRLNLAIKILHKELKTAVEDAPTPSVFHQRRQEDEMPRSK
jgi:RNA polymerase sigma-70 factor (ECF subfamily)